MYVRTIKNLSVILILAMGLSSCFSKKLSYHEITNEGQLKETTVKSNSSIRKCIRTETVQYSDTTTHQITAKSITVLNCKGAWSEIMFCKKWDLENGKLKRLKDDCKPKKF